MGSAFTQAGKVVEHVLLRRDGNAVASGRAKAPILQGFEDLAVNRRRQTLNHSLLDDVAALVDGDFDHDVTLKAIQFGCGNNRVGRDDGQSGANLFSGQRSLQNCTQGRTSGTGRYRLSGQRRFGLSSNFRAWQLRLARLRGFGAALPGQVRVQLSLSRGARRARGSVIYHLDSL